MTPAEFAALAIALGAPATDFRLDSAWRNTNGLPAPLDPSAAVRQVRMALLNVGVVIPA